MIIKSLHLRNIRSYLDEKIDFPLGSTLLSGDIGSGKSTILMAIDFSIFGLRKGELSGADLLRHGKDEGSIELGLVIDSKDIKIRRGLKRSASITQESCSLDIDGIKEKLTPVELKARMLELLGYPLELIKKNKPIFRYTVYTPQEEMKKILSEGEDRLEILRKIFNIDKYGMIRNNSRLFMTELRSMKRELDAYSQDLEIKAAEKRECEKGMNSISLQLSEIRGKIISINARYSEKAASIETTRLRMEELRKNQLAATKKEAELNSMKRKAEDLSRELANIEGKIQFNMNLFPEASGGNLLDVSAGIKSMEKERDILISSIASLDSEIEKMSKIFSKGVCAFCGQKVSDPSSFKKHIEEKKEKHDEVMKKITAIESKLEEEKKKKTAIEKFHAIQSTIKDLRDWKEGKEKESLQTEISLKEAEKEILRLRLMLREDESLESMFREMESELLSIQREKMESEKALSRIEQQKDDMERHISSLEKEIEKKEASRKKAEKASGMLAWFENFISLMENIEKHVLLTVQKEFDQFFQYWFSILMGDSLSVRIDEQFSPIIEQNGFETSFDNLSGGEKTSVSLAYRLALNKVINILIDEIRTKDLLILDEPTDGFSSDQLDRVRDVINALGLKQVIIVSHEPKIDTYVENVIKIYKEDHVSRIVQ